MQGAGLSEPGDAGAGQGAQAPVPAPGAPARQAENGRPKHLDGVPGSGYFAKRLLTGAR